MPTNCALLYIAMPPFFGSIHAAGAMRMLWRRSLRPGSSRVAHDGAGVRRTRRPTADARVRAALFAPFPANVPRGALGPPARAQRSQQLCPGLRGPHRCADLTNEELSGRLLRHSA